MTPPPAAAVPSAVAPEGEFSCDIDVDGAAPAGGPPSRQGLPSWVDAAASDDPSQDPVMATMAARRSRITRISAVAVGAVGLMVFAVLFLRHGDKPGARTPVAVSRSVPAPPPPPAVATREIAPASRPVAPAPRAVVPPPPRPVAVAPTPKPVAPPRPVAVAPPPKPVAPPPRPVHAEPPAPRPVAAAPRTVASVHNSDAPPAAAAPRAHSAASTEDNQRRAHEAYLRGNAKLLQGGIDEAIVAFKEALKLDPHDAIAERGLGLAYLQAGNAGQAVQHLRRYLRGAPGASDRPLIEKRIEQLSGR